MDHARGNQSWISRDDFDIEAQARHSRSRSHHRRGRSVPRRNESEGWITVEEESPKHPSRSRDEADGRELMLSFMRRGRGLVDLDRLRWARGMVERNTRSDALKKRLARERQLRREEGILIEKERRLNKDRQLRPGDKERAERQRAEVERCKKEDHEWDIIQVRRAEEDWRRSNEDIQRDIEDREWGLWLDEQKMGHEEHHVRVVFRDMEETERPDLRGRPHPDDNSSESAGPSDRSRRTAQPLQRSSSSIWQHESHRKSQSVKQAMEIRAREMERRKKEDRLRIREDDVRRGEDIDRTKELRRREGFRAFVEHEESQDRIYSTAEAAARGELAQRWAWIQTQWQKVLMLPIQGHDDDKKSDESARAMNERDDTPPRAIAEMHRHGSEHKKGLVTFALPQHSKIDVYTTRYVSHTTTSGVPKRKDAWLIGGMKDFYKNDVRGTRGVGLHLLNTISFAKFIRFERCRDDGLHHHDEFDKELERWTCTGQQFLIPLKYSAEYGKFRWMINRHEESGIQWMTMLETLMKQVRHENDVKIVVFLYESLDLQTAGIAAGVAIVLGIAAALVYGFLKKDIQTAMEIGGSLTGLLGIVGGAGGWANQFGRETPSTPAGGSYAYDTACRVECIEDDGK